MPRRGRIASWSGLRGLSVPEACRGDPLSVPNRGSVMDRKQLKELRRLARLHGIQTEYRATSGRLRPAAPEALLGVLKCLGAPIDGEAGLTEALRRRRHAVRTRRV